MNRWARTLLDAIPARLPELRRKHGFTQREFARLIRVSQSHLSRAEHGHSHLSFASRKLAAACIAAKADNLNLMRAVLLLPASKAEVAR